MSIATCLSGTFRAVPEDDATAAPVLYELDGAIAYVTLNRADAGNAIDVALAQSLRAAVARADDDHSVRCVVLRARGRLFCAGGDVTRLHAAGDSLPGLLRDILDDLHPAIARLATMAKPVVTAIQGPAAGAGLALATIGDFALAEPAAHFTMAYSRIGLSPDGGATWLLPRLVGLRRAQELALTNRRLAATEAAAIGLVTRVVAEGSLADETVAVATALATSPTGALGRTKRLLHSSDGASLEEQLAAEYTEIVAQGATRESRVGLDAFAARQEPDFLSARD